MPFLLHDQYTEFAVSDVRHDLLSETGKAVFDHITSTELPGPRQVADALGPVVRQRRLLLHSFHPDEQALFAHLEIDGAVPPIDGDYLSVAASNVGAGKIDQFLKKSTEYDMTVDPATGDARATVRVVLANGSPASGLPDYVIGNSVGLPIGTSYMAVAVSTPLTMEHISLDGGPVSIGPHTENDRNVYSAIVTIPPGAIVTLEMQLHGVLHSGKSYSLTALPQAAVGTEHLTVHVRTVGGWRPNVASGANVVGDSAEFDEDLPSVTRLTVGFEPA